MGVEVTLSFEGSLSLGRLILRAQDAVGVDRSRLLRGFLARLNVSSSGLAVRENLAEHALYLASKFSWFKWKVNDCTPGYAQFETWGGVLEFKSIMKGLRNTKGIRYGVRSPKAEDLYKVLVYLCKPIGGIMAGPQVAVKLDEAPMTALQALAITGLQWAGGEAFLSAANVLQDMAYEGKLAK